MWIEHLNTLYAEKPTQEEPGTSETATNRGTVVTTPKSEEAVKELKNKRQQAQTK